MQYFVTKTGMEMFDTSRAFGLAYILYRLGLIMDFKEEVKIKDVGFYYEVNGPKIDKISGHSFNDERWVSLFDHNQSWWRNLYPTRIQKNSIKKVMTFLRGYTSEDEIKTNDFRESFVRSMIARKVLTENLTNLLNKYCNFYIVEVKTNVRDLKKGYWTLPQDIDLSACKGIRDVVRGKKQYTEGENIGVPLDDLALAQIGFAFSKKVLGKFTAGKPSFTLTFMPNPKNIEIESHYNITKELDKKWLCNVSEGTCLSHYATYLANLIRGKLADNETTPEYSSLIFNVLKPTAQQPKPGGGGLFPLEFLYSLLESNLEISEGIFEIWDNVFQIGNRKGNEDLAFSLSEFIAHPSLENWEKYQRVHLRYLSKEGVRIKAYPEECIKEVMKNVRS